MREADAGTHCMSKAAEIPPPLKKYLRRLNPPPIAFCKPYRLQKRVSVSPDTSVHARRRSLQLHRRVVHTIHKAIERSENYGSRASHVGGERESKL